MSFQIPTVTVDDLRLFHTKHFPNAPLPSRHLASAEHSTPTPSSQYDGGFGYYDDGSVRMVTDEQIAMFRHSEIHAILRARRKQRDREEEEASIIKTTASSNSDEPVLLDNTTKAPPEESRAFATTESGQTSLAVNRTKQRSPGRSTSGSKQGQKNNWTAVGAKSKAKNKLSRKRNKENRRERKRQRREGSAPSRGTNEDYDDEESDEWDPWHQANGPDTKQSANIKLDY